MKQIIVLIVAASLVAVIASFVGIGFGLGALSTASPAPQVNYNPQPTDVNGVLQFHVDFINVAQAGNSAQLLTNILPGGKSTSLVFGTSVSYDGNGCGPKPVWSGGGGDYYVLTFSSPVTGLIGTGSGTQVATTAFTTGSGMSYVVSENGTYTPGAADPTLSYCINPGSGPAWRVPAGDFWINTLVITGTPSGAPITTPITVSISLLSEEGQFCPITTTNNGAQCPQLPNYPTVDTVGGFFLGNTPIAQLEQGLCKAIGCSGVEFLAAPSASATYQSGYASAKVLNAGSLAYNGGQIQVSVSTGYGGFSVCLLTPQPRPNGGHCDPEFPNQTVASGGTQIVTWNVPSGAAQNASTEPTGWNTWELQITNEYFELGYTPVTIDIAPQYAPGMPVITFTTNGTFYYPRVGDVVTLTIYANATGTSAGVTGITIWLYYLPPGVAATSEPTCGSNEWITNACPGGYALAGSQLAVNGKNAVGTYTFTVAPPGGSTQIAVLAEGFTSSQQGSPIMPYTIQITPQGCTVGAPGCIKKNAVSEWETIGPILLSAALILAGVLVALIVPVTWGRVLGVAVPVVLVIIGYLWFYTPLFQPGGFFNVGVA